MTEIGRIHPEKKAACPHCGHILPGRPERAPSQCPRCKKPIRHPGKTPAASAGPWPRMNIATQILRRQILEDK